MNLSEMRTDYLKDSMNEADLSDNPIEEFQKWFSRATENGVLEPNAMALGTVDAEGQPSVRIVLLKGLDAQGFVFFTNYESRKGKELTEFPKAALTFFWGELEQQVRIEGRVEAISAAESDEYYNSRDKGSRLGAWASPQSQIIPNREFLEEKVKEVVVKFQDTEHPPRPPFWGGFRVIPHRIEFWQGRQSRLHDRIVFEKKGENWEKYRIAP